MIAALPWRDRWPLIGLLLGALAGAVGMVGGQLAKGATSGQVVFTAIFVGLFLTVVLLLARGNAARLAKLGAARVPTREPLKTALVGLMITAIVMWLVAGYGIFIAVITTNPANDWHALAYLGVAVCATAATVMVRQARGEWAEFHLRAWPTEP